ncbi:MAG: sulfatase [Leptospiraceae bacterium]|nr:sulfatase [Leptospiraceae bacterium]
MSHCDSEIVKPIHLDIPRSILKLNQFRFDDSNDLTFHWKKNPSRFSNPKNPKYSNLQIGIQEDSILFRNESKDSLMLSPNSSLEINFPSLISFFQTDYLVLQGSGKLQLYSNNEILYEKEISYSNKWETLKIEKKMSNLKFVWVGNSFLFLGAPRSISKEISKPNIILIVIDALRKDALGSYGNQFKISPTLDELAKDSVKFNSHFANANWTKPSMISLFYGDYSSNLGITSIGFPISVSEKLVFYSQKNPGLVNILREENYYTKSIMNNVFLQDYTGVGVDLGFHDLTQIGKDISDTEEITKSAIKFLESSKEETFFLHINYNTPHGSYSPPNRILKKIEEETAKEVWNTKNSIIKRYYGEVRYVDEEIQKIIHVLKKLNLYEESHIIITSDHGDLFEKKHSFEENKIFGTQYGHGETHYDEEIAIPLIWKFPNSVSKSLIQKEFDGMSSGISLVPTLLSSLNIEYDKKLFKGKDFFHFLKTNSGESKEEFVYTEGRMSESIRTNTMKYIRRFSGFTNYYLDFQPIDQSKLEEAYDLEKDPQELSPIVVQDEWRKILYENSLKKNSLKIFFPKESLPAKINLNLVGEIYRFEFLTGEGKSIAFNKNNIQFEVPFQETNVEIRIMITNPETRFYYSLDTKTAQRKLRLGKWGILDKVEINNSRIIFSETEPDGLKKSKQVWAYLDGALINNSSIERTKKLQTEVMSVLKSWGYIQE